MLHEGFNSRKMPWLVVSWMSMVKEKEKKKLLMTLARDTGTQIFSFLSFAFGVEFTFFSSFHFPNHPPFFPLASIHLPHSTLTKRTRMSSLKQSVKINSTLPKDLAGTATTIFLSFSNYYTEVSGRIRRVLTVFVALVCCICRRVQEKIGRASGRERVL